MQQTFVAICICIAALVAVNSAYPWQFAREQDHNLDLQNLVRLQNYYRDMAQQQENSNYPDDYPGMAQQDYDANYPEMAGEQSFQIARTQALATEQAKLQRIDNILQLLTKQSARYQNLRFMATLMAGEDPYVCPAIIDITEVVVPKGQVRIILEILGYTDTKVLESLERYLKEIKLEGKCEIEVLYYAICNIYRTTITIRGYYYFLQIVNEISLTRLHYCRASGALVGVEDFEDLRQQFLDASSAEDARRIVGIMLCLIRIGGTPPGCPTCECPAGGLEAAQCACQFMACLGSETGRKIIGIDEDMETRAPQCLAFVMDTTGSMREEIDATRRIILNFIKSEEAIEDVGCYVLVPFNDRGGVVENSVGPISIADPKMATSLQDFVAAFEALRADGGGDEPEFANDGILGALNSKRLDGSPALVSGSQIIVVTDASTKNPGLESGIIEQANVQGNCIHFFIPVVGFDSAIADGSYQRIADQTGGNLVGRFTNLQLGTFIAENARRPCRSPPEPPITDGESRVCHDIVVSGFANLLKIVIGANQPVTLTSPSGAKTPITPRDGFEVFSQAMPEPGTWSVCSDSGEEIVISASIENAFDVTTAYSVCTDSDSNTTLITPPTACSIGKIVIATSRSDDIMSAFLVLINLETGLELQRRTLTNCKSSLATVDTKFPPGTFTYIIEGIDIDGKPFSYELPNRATFEVEEENYSLTPDNDEVQAINITTEFTIAFTFENRGEFCTEVDVSTIQIDGFETSIVEPAEETVTVYGKSSLNVILKGHVTDETLEKGVPYTFTVTVSNDCFSLTAQGSVIIPLPPPPPPTEGPTTPTPSTSVPPTASEPPPCTLACLNGGTCVFKKTEAGKCDYPICECLPDFGGPYCEFDYRPTPSIPPPVNRARARAMARARARINSYYNRNINEMGYSQDYGQGNDQGYYGR